MQLSDRKTVWARCSFLIGPLLVVLISIGFWWKVVLTNEYTPFNDADMAQQVVPWFQFEASELHQGRLPLWDPNQWFGQPLVGQMIPGITYPLNWLLLAAPLKNGWVNQAFLHWYWLIIHLMGALFAYWFCRDQGSSRGAALVGGTLYGHGGFVGNNGWPVMINGAVWGPLVFLFLFRSVRGRRPWSSAALSGFFLGFSFLSGHHQAPLFISLAVAGVWLFFILREKKVNWRVLRLAAVAGVMAAMAAALVMLPAFEYGKLALRWVGLTNPVGWESKVPYMIHARYGFGPLSIFGLVVPGWSGYSSGLVGVAGLTLALIGMAANWRRVEARVVTFAGLGGLLFSLADFDVLHGILYAVLPMVEKARAPAMAIVVFDLAVAVLAAWGVDSLLRTETAQIRRRAARAVSVFALSLFASILLIELFKGFPSNGDARPAVTMLAAILLAGLLYASLRGALKAGALATMLLLLVMLELGNGFPYRLHSRYEQGYRNFLEQHPKDGDLAQYLLGQPGFFRVEVNHDAIPYNFGDFYGIPQNLGYLASITRILENQEVFSGEFLRLAGVRYTLSPAPLHPGEVERFTGTSGVKVFENPDVLPRAFVVSKAERLPEPKQAAAWLRRPQFNMATETYVTGDAPRLGACEDPGGARVLVYHSGYVRISADAHCKGMVVLTDTYYPGWSASVDGHSAPIYDAYAVFRGVVVAPGEHTVEFRYRPWSVMLGAASSAIALVLAILLVFWERRRPGLGGDGDD